MITKPELVTEHNLRQRMERGEYDQDPVLFLDDLMAVYVLDEDEITTLIHEYWADGLERVLEAVKDIYEHDQRQ